MLKKRIIPIQLLENGRLVKSIKFLDKRDVGDPVKSSKIYSDQDADELILLNISRKENSFEELLRIVKKISESCFVPLSVGGGINNLDDVRKLFRAGADKVILNSIAFKAPELISDIAFEFGSQAVIVGVDLRKDSTGYSIYSECGTKREIVTLEKHLQTLFQLGPGEILIQSIDRDGVMCGYDLPLVKSVLAQKTSMPVIIAGGAGNFNHLKEVFMEGVSAAACGSLFNFGDNNPLRAKSFLKNYGIPLKKI